MKSMNQIALLALKNKVGNDTFTELMNFFRGETIYFGDDPEERRQNIKQDFIHGMPISELARKYKKSEDAIYRILERNVN